MVMAHSCCELWGLKPVFHTARLVLVGGIVSRRSTIPIKCSVAGRRASGFERAGSSPEQPVPTCRLYGSRSVRASSYVNLVCVRKMSLVGIGYSCIGKCNLETRSHNRQKPELEDVSMPRRSCLIT